MEAQLASSSETVKKKGEGHYGNIAAALASLPSSGLETMLCLLPPPQQWYDWVKLKEPFFKPSLQAKGRAPFPHITLIQSRVDTDSVTEALTNCIDEICVQVEKRGEQAFSLDLSTVGSFDFGRNSVIYATVTDATAKERVNGLHEIAESAMETQLGASTKANGGKKEEFTLHVGLGTVRTNKLSKTKAEYAAELEKMSTDFYCEHIYLLLRGPSGPWIVATATPLYECEGSKPSVPVGSLTSLSAQIGEKC